VLRQMPNLLSATRLVAAAVWLAAFVRGPLDPAFASALAVGAAASDFFDGRTARRIGCANLFGQWLDCIADVVFVLTALTCESRGGAIPLYIPILIAVSFSQYAIDSILIRGSSVPLKSGLGHWGGIMNYVLVIVLALGPSPQWPGIVVRAISPLVAIFYVAAISERALSYEAIRRIGNAVGLRNQEG
jgi:phosphatidylglycerophosphate synthase